MDGRVLASTRTSRRLFFSRLRVTAFSPRTKLDLKVIKDIKQKSINTAVGDLCERGKRDNDEELVQDLPPRHDRCELLEPSINLPEVTVCVQVVERRTDRHINRVRH